ncbi:Uncharacterised protein g10268 [Pycnogonum litorale]
MTNPSGPFNYPLLWAMFLSSVLLMFLFCYCIQKAVGKSDRVLSIPLSETQTTGMQTIESCTFVQTSLIDDETPPPSYENLTSIKNDFEEDLLCLEDDEYEQETREESSPPSYDTAVSLIAPEGRQASP